MNTFEVKCPFDLEFTITRSEEEKETGDWSWVINPDKTTFDLTDMFWDSNQILNFSPDGTTVQVMTHPGWGFVSDTPRRLPTDIRWPLPWRSGMSAGTSRFLVASSSMATTRSMWPESGSRRQRI